MENDHEHGQPESEYKSESECKPEPQIKRKESKGKRLETAADWKREEEEEKKRKEKEEKKERQYPNPSGDLSDNEGGELTSSPKTPDTPRVDLIGDVQGSSEASDGNPSVDESSSRDQTGKTPSAQEALASYLSAQRSTLCRQSYEVIAHLEALPKGNQWTFQEDFLNTATALTQASGFLNTVGTASTDISDAIERLKADAKKVAPPPTEDSNPCGSFGASSVMYFLTFFLGRWLTTATGCGILLSGAGGQAALAVLANNLVVPLTQAMLGDPMGTALRNYGPNVPSEDSRLYATFITAHAVYVRSCISGIPPEDYDPVVEMDRVINEVAWREHGRPDLTTNESTTKGTWFSSKVRMIIHPKKPAAEVNEKLKANPYSRVERTRVVGRMLARILVSDEVPVHTFSFFNGVTGVLNNLWPSLLGVSNTQLAVARVIDATMHTAAGIFAMFVMFQMQDMLRPIVQSAQRVDPSDEEYRKLKQAPYVPTLLAASSKQDHVKEVAETLQRLREQLKIAQKLLPPKSLDKDRLDHLQRQVKALHKRYEQKIKALQGEIDTANKEALLLDSASNKVARTVLDTWRVFSGRSAKSSGEAWTDGSPSVVRGISKYLGYATALVPTTMLSIHVAQGIGDNYKAIKQQVADAQNAALANGGLLLTSNQAQARYQGSARAWAPQVPEVTASNVTLTREQIASAHNPYLTASAFNATVAIAGWNLRNVALDPLFQHIIHAGIGLAERGFSLCCGSGSADDTDSQGVVDLTALSLPSQSNQEIVDALARIEANLKMSADELRRLRVLVIGDELGNESLAQGNDDELSQIPESRSTSGADSFSESSETRCVSESESESGSAEKDKD